MPRFDVANSLQYSMPDYVGIAQASRQNALAGRQMEQQEARNALAREQFTAEQGQQNEQRARQWGQAALTHARKNPAMAPQVIQEGKKMGFLPPDFPDQLTPDQIESIAVKMGIPRDVPFEETPEAALENLRTKNDRLQNWDKVQQDEAQAAMEHKYRLQEIGAQGEQTRLTQGSQNAYDKAQARAQAQQDVKAAVDQKGRSSAYNTWIEARNGLMQATAGTLVGPIGGRLPNFTAKRQEAEGSVAALAPILKSLFRVSGEGTFTDKDQDLLMKMVPTQKDYPEARKAKLENMDRIIRGKLGIAQQGPRQAPKQASKYPEGTIIQNAQGQKMVRKGGQWQPM